MATGNVTDSNFDSDVLQSGGTVLVDFWAEWCPPCKALGPKLEELSEELPNVKILKLNVDENREMPAKYGVRGIPTMIIFKGGKLVEQVTGNLAKDKIKSILQQHS